VKNSKNLFFKNMKTDDSLVIWIIIFFAGFGVGVLLNFNKLSVPIVPEWILDTTNVVIATFVAAAGGSYFAFRLEREHDRRVRETENLVSVNKVLFEIGRAINSLYIVIRQFLDPYEKSPIRAFEVRAIAPLNPNNFNPDLTSIGFFLETEHISMLSEIAMAFESYTTAVNV